MKYQRLFLSRRRYIPLWKFSPDIHQGDASGAVLLDQGLWRFDNFEDCLRKCWENCLVNCYNGMGCNLLSKFEEFPLPSLSPPCNESAGDFLCLENYCSCDLKILTTPVDNLPLIGRLKLVVTSLNRNRNFPLSFHPVSTIGDFLFSRGGSPEQFDTQSPPDDPGGLFNTTPFPHMKCNSSRCRQWLS